MAHGAEHVVLMGASMGGAIVASYLRHAEDTSVVTAVVLDSPALSLQRTVEWGLRRLPSPGPRPAGAGHLGRRAPDVLALRPRLARHRLRLGHPLGRPPHTGLPRRRGHHGADRDQS
ncbi:MAG: alpha/beta hydrolase [Tetrasphaera sp.]|nr:alpha/beta hydrolase [Tetrasphaera sp.]